MILTGTSVGVLPSSFTNCLLVIYEGLNLVPILSKSCLWDSLSEILRGSFYLGSREPLYMSDSFFANVVYSIKVIVLIIIIIIYVIIYSSDHYPGFILVIVSNTKFVIIFESFQRHDISFSQVFIFVEVILV